MPSIGVECSDYVAVDGILNLQSDDGQLNEALSLTISLTENDIADLSSAFFVELDADALDGTLALSNYLSTSDYDVARLFLSGEVVDGSLSGVLYAQGEGTSGDMAFADSTTIAAFEAE